MGDNGWFVPLGEDDANLAVHKFVPEALTLARELRGKTKADLALAVHKTPGAISQFEGGSARPDARTLKAIGLALGFPVSFFARKLSCTTMSMDRCHFRSLRSASQKDRRQVLASGALLSNLVEVLEDYVDLPEEQVTSAARHVSTDDEIERYAVEVRKAWGLGIGPIPDLVKLLEGKGIIVSFVSQDSDSVDAFSTWQSQRPYIFLVPTKGSSSRTRYDCAHELGHLLMHPDVSPGDKFLETQANRFAGAFLVPRDAFLQECPTRLNWEHFYELKKRWRVSVAALIKRARDLDCISDATYRRAFMHLNQTGERTNERYEPPVEYPRLVSRSVQAALEDLSRQDLAEKLCIRTSELEWLLTTVGGVCED